jgi:hypothetical protein
MKRSLLLAIGVLALTATSQQIFAAESETAAPQERAAPAADRERAPARQRQLQRAPAQRQAPQSSSPSSSFTGSQAGGFGGGNTGGGGFSDPANCASAGFSPLCPLTSQGLSAKAGFAGGGEFSQMFPLGPYAAFGWAVDVTGSTLKSSGTQITSRVLPLSSPLGPGETVTETLSTSQSQPVNTTLRAKIGFVPVGLSNIMVFATAGGAVGKVSGSFTYTANNFSTPQVGIPTTAFGASSWDLTRFGYAAGAGVTVRYTGVSVTLEYLYTNLGTITETTPLVASHCSILASCTSFAQTQMRTDSSTVRLKFGFGL